jgi:Arc/MetJ family transcription regulator
MRTTITLDDKLVEQAMEFTGIKERSTLITAGLEELVRKEAIRRLIALGGTDPTASVPPRRRLPVDNDNE